MDILCCGLSGGYLQCYLIFFRIRDWILFNFVAGQWFLSSSYLYNSEMVMQLFLVSWKCLQGSYSEGILCCFFNGRWNRFLVYNVSIIFLKALFLIPGCIFGEYMIKNWSWLDNLLGIQCIKTFSFPDAFVGEWVILTRCRFCSRTLYFYWSKQLEIDRKIWYGSVMIFITGKGSVTFFLSE